MKFVFRTLCLSLLSLALAIGLYIVHDYLVPITMDFVIFSSVRGIRLAGLLLSAALASLLAASIVAYPIARMFPRLPALAGFGIALPTVVIRLPYVFHNSGLPFSVAAFAIEVFSIAVFVPYCAYFASHLIRRAGVRPA